MFPRTRINEMFSLVRDRRLTCLELLKQHRPQKLWARRRVCCSLLWTWHPSCTRDFGRVDYQALWKAAARVPTIRAALAASAAHAEDLSVSLDHLLCCGLLIKDTLVRCPVPPSSSSRGSRWKRRCFFVLTRLHTALGPTYVNIFVHAMAHKRELQMISDLIGINYTLFKDSKVVDHQ